MHMSKQLLQKPQLQYTNTATCKRRSACRCAFSPPKRASSQKAAPAFQQPLLQVQQPNSSSSSSSPVQLTQQDPTLQRLRHQLELQQNHHQQPYVPAPDAEGRAKQLTADISHKRHWSQLQNLWLDNAAALSPIHLTALLCRLARLASSDGIDASDRPEVFKFSGALLSAITESIPQLDSRGMAQCLWAYAKLQSTAPHSSSSGDAAAAALAATLLLQGHIQQLQPSQLSQAAWAAATLQAMGMTVPVGYWAAVEAHTLQLMPQLKPCEVACCAWAVTKCTRKLSHNLAAAVQGHFVAAADAYRPRELLQVMLALAMADQSQQPQQQQAHDSSSSDSSSTQSSSWLAVCYAKLQQHAPYLSTREVSSSLLALSRLNARNTPISRLTSGCHQLPVSLSVRLLKRALDTLPNSSPRDLVTMAYALARLQLNPGPWWWASCLPFSAAALHVCSPSMLAVLAWSLARLGVQPTQGWLQELLQHSGYKVQGFGVQETTMLMCALGKWRACPDLTWWTAFEDATQHMLSYYTAAELAGLLCGMGNTGPPAPQQQQQLFPPVFTAHTLRLQQEQQHQDRQQHAVPSDLQDSQPAADYLPGGAWTAAMLVSAQKALSGAPAGALGGIAMGLAKLGIHPSCAWLGAFEAAVLAALPQANLKEVAAVLWGLSVMGAQPSMALVLAVDARIMAVLTPGRPREESGATDGLRISTDTASATSAAGSAAVEQLQQWSVLLGSSAVAPLAAAGTAGGEARDGFACSRPSAAVAAQLLWSAAWLSGKPQGVAAWADDLLVAAMPALGSASRDTLFVLLRALTRLQHAPGCKQWVDVWWQAYAAHLPAAQAASPAGPPIAGSVDATVDSDGSSGESSSTWQAGPCAELFVHQQFDSSCDGLDDVGLPKGQQQRQLNKLQYSPAAEQACFQLTVVLWCFRQLRMQPSLQTAWLQTVLAATRPLLHQLSAKRFRLLLAQMVELKMWPGEEWLAAAEATLVQQYQHMRYKQVEQTVAHLRALGWNPKRGHLRRQAAAYECVLPWRVVFQLVPWINNTAEVERTAVYSVFVL